MLKVTKPHADTLTTNALADRLQNEDRKDTVVVYYRNDERTGLPNFLEFWSGSSTSLRYGFKPVLPFEKRTFEANTLAECLSKAAATRQLYVFTRAEAEKIFNHHQTL